LQPELGVPEDEATGAAAGRVVDDGVTQID